MPLSEAERKPQQEAAAAESASQAGAPPGEPPWASLRDEELLQWRLSDLRVRIEGSELESRVVWLYEELKQRGLPFRPECYLGDEWFSPEGSPAIAIPFYLAHPRLKQLELHQMLEVEGGTAEWCLKLLRHECGHALDHACRFSAEPEWRAVFGNPESHYEPDTYRPRPYSKSFVRHLPNWYAQSHPDEDFAETFAVWLASPPEEWRERYRGWKALDKLEFVDALMERARHSPPALGRPRRISEASRLRKTLARHYAVKRRLYAEDFPDFYDSDLRAIFNNGEPGLEPAARIMRGHRAALLSSIVRWTGQRKYTVDMLIRKLMVRCRELNLAAPRDQTRLFVDLSAYLAALVTNHLHTGRFKRTV
jgi:hypothetical protein